MPNYLIIILNRGKGNIFNCNVQIPETFCPSNYVENEKNCYFKLIGVVIHFGESGMGGHFIAFCKHYIDGKWRCYNDNIVNKCQNDYLQKGTPYILFYQKERSDNSFQNIQGINNGIFNMNQINVNNQMNSIQNLFINNNQQINMFPNRQQNQNNINNNFQQNFIMYNNNNSFNTNNMNLNNNFNNFP